MTNEIQTAQERLNRKKVRLSTSFLASLLLVGSLLGNAYMATVVGYPPGLQSLGDFLIIVGLVVAIPAWISLLPIAALGWEPKGRESFIESNPGLWIYCFVFYAFLIYAVRRLWAYYRTRRAERQISSTHDL
jgi:hypothetical protein